MKLAVVGLGFMGATHVKAILQSSKVQLGGVVSSSEPKRGGDLSGVHGNLGGPAGALDFSSIDCYSTIEECLNDPAIDAVDLCLPTNLHASVTRQALQAGKHVLVEKPMALSGEEADSMIEEARRRKRTLMVAQVLRFFPAYTALEQCLLSGRLGRVLSASFRRRCAAPGWSAWLASREHSGGGVFDLLIHDIDMCLLLFGQPHAVSAAGREDLPKGIDLLGARFHYPDIPFVTVSGGWYHPGSYPFSMDYTVVGEHGSVEYSSAGTPPTLYPAGGHPQMLTLPDVDGYQAEIEYFVECCERGIRPERCPPESSADSVRLARAVSEARKGTGEKIAWTA